MTKSLTSNPPTTREGITFAKLFQLFTLPFSPKKMQTYLAVKSVLDLDPDKLLADGIKGVLLDADGTLGPDKCREFPEPIISHITKMKASGLKIAIFTNASEDRFHQFSDIPIVTEVHPKPDPRGFQIAMKQYLKLDDPREVAMVGDNYVTDGGAIALGMRFVYVDPIVGNEKWAHRASRQFAYYCARFYHPKTFRDENTPPSSTTG